MKGLGPVNPSSGALRNLRHRLAKFVDARSTPGRGRPAGGRIAAALVVLAQAAGAADLDPATVPAFVNALPNPLDPANIWQPDSKGGNVYTLNVQQTTQTPGLGAGIPATTVWAYGKTGQAPTSPGRTFEATQGKPIKVNYVNKLVDAGGKPLANWLPVDETLDWANPGAIGGIKPVPLVAHLHGGNSQYQSDGLPEAWSTPCVGIPCKAEVGNAQQYSKTFTYDNSQESGMLWYHDHAHGITRLNVYAGLAGMYLLRDANENTLRSKNVLPSYPYEIPVVLQDRMFSSDGQLFYPSDSGDPALPLPTHLPEFFGNVMLVNGKAWPKLNVEPRKYRLRMLNGSDSRFYDLRVEIFAANAAIVPGQGTPVPFWVVGNELGLLNSPAVPDLNGAAGVLPIGPGERYDLVVDFTKVPMGSRVVVTNTAREPYPDAEPTQPLMDRVMAFDVNMPLNKKVANATVAVATKNAAGKVVPGTNLRPLLGALPVPKTAGVPVRRIMLFEGTDSLGRLQTMIGPVDQDPTTGQQGTLVFKDPVTERPKVGTTEIWEFYNTTVDAHPIHMHLVDFRILSRQDFTANLAPLKNTDQSDGGFLDPASIVLGGQAVAPGAWEAGKKDTVKVFPGQVARVLVTFKRTGQYVYHCHILSHEDHEMMRPFEVIP